MNETKSPKTLHLKIAAALVLAGVILAAYLSPLRQWLTIENVRAAIAGVKALWYAPLLFIAAFALGAVAFLPATVFMLSAGLIWGWKLGGTYSLIGALLGAGISFYVARFIGGGVLQRFGSMGERVGRILESAGFRTLLILRVIPLLPFPVYNYAAGIARVRASDYMLSTAIGVAPAMYVIAYSADALFSGSLTKEGAFGRLLMVAMLMLLLIGIPALLKKRAEKALHLEPEA